MEDSPSEYFTKFPRWINVEQLLVTHLYTSTGFDSSTSEQSRVSEGFVFTSSIARVPKSLRETMILPSSRLVFNWKMTMSGHLIVENISYLPSFSIPHADTIACFGEFPLSEFHSGTSELLVMHTVS